MQGAKQIIDKLGIIGTFRNVVVVDSFKSEIRIDTI